MRERVEDFDSRGIAKQFEDLSNRLKRLPSQHLGTDAFEKSRIVSVGVGEEAGHISLYMNICSYIKAKIKTVKPLQNGLSELNHGRCVNTINV
jgi:hypothetical protein